jgi:molecular chaperone DnaJ
MQLKDYYSILELEPSATIPEIKKAYRKLAHRYHPDKNHHDPYASAQFAEIKEAYEVLTDPGKKEYYLQQRWYNQSMGKRKTQAVITPVNVLLQALELEKYVSTLDVFRMDKEGLKDYILALLPDTVIEQLLQFQEPETIREIVTTVIRALHPLPPAYTGSILSQLHQLSSGDPATAAALKEYEQKTNKRTRREKNTLILVILVTLALCLLIFLAGR